MWILRVLLGRHLSQWNASSEWCMAGPHGGSTQGLNTGKELAHGVRTSGIWESAAWDHKETKSSATCWSLRPEGRPDFRDHPWMSVDWELYVDGSNLVNSQGELCGICSGNPGCCH
nr:uncharacterized protein LOC129528720 [Gorilla gorilla gorilla]